MDDKRTQNVERSDIAKITSYEINAQVYETYILNKIKKLIEILESDNIIECLDKLVVFETMFFHNRLLILEFTCRFLLEKNSWSGEYEVSYDIPAAAIKQHSLQLPTKVRFFYQVSNDLYKNKKLTNDQILAIHELHHELKCAIILNTSIKDPVKRLIAFVDQNK